MSDRDIFKRITKAARVLLQREDNDIRDLIIPSKFDAPPKTRTLPRGKKLLRFYNPSHGKWDQGRSFGPLKNQRFDHHPAPKGAQKEWVWYASGALAGAVAESFGNQNIIDKNSNRRICVVETLAPLQLVDLFEEGPRYLGLDQRICTTTDYNLTQELARKLYLQFPSFVGIHWPGRQAGLENIVFTDRMNMQNLRLVYDSNISDNKVWIRIANAARKCKIRTIC